MQSNLGNYWHATAGIQGQTRPQVAGNIATDVVIVGGGFTGLWTAYYLKRLKPEYDVIILEAEYIGFGASGRNGGWVIPSITGLERCLKGYQAAARRECCELLCANVQALADVIEAEGLDCEFHTGGALELAVSYPAQETRQQAQLKALTTLGYARQHLQWLNRDELQRYARPANAYGAILSTNHATLHPGKLLKHLAAKVESLGVRIYEKSPVTTCESGAVRTHNSKVHAKISSVIATEGYSHGLKPLNRYIIPAQSLIIATQPLNAQQWDDIGIHARFAFADASRVINYGHRTADGRLVFGARGSYRFGGRPRYAQALDAREITLRRQILARLFPAVADIDIDYAWGGSLGVSRRFRPHVIIQTKGGMSTAGGYGGEGIAGSHLFARTLAEGMVGISSRRTQMPWVYRQQSLTDVLKPWEPEPLRWLGASTMLRLFAAEDGLLRRDSTSARWLGPLSALNRKLATLIS